MDSSIDAVTKLFSINVGPFDEIKKLESLNNEVYLVKVGDSKQYIVKLYQSHSLNTLRLPSVETFAHEKLLDCPYIKPLIASGYEGNTEFAIFKYIPGKTLLECLPTLNYPQQVSIALDIINFLHSCQRVSIARFGDIGSSGKGQHGSWFEFLLDYIRRLEQRAARINATTQVMAERYLVILNNVLQKQKDLFYIETPCLVPADLNFNNIIIDELFHARIIDIETLVSGDIHFALGELMAHTYGTSICNRIFSTYPELVSADIYKIRFYALLSNLSILLFILEQGCEDPSSVTPWGNSITFIELMNTHLYYLGNTTPSSGVSFTDLLSSGFFNSDFGLKNHSSLGNRSVLVKETLEKILPVAEKAGITRYPEITQLDKTGVIAFQCVRPDAQIDDDTFTVFSGRGQSKEESLVSAIAEAIERFCAEKKNYPSHKIETSSYIDLQQRGMLAVHPREFNAPASIAFSESETLEWLPSVNLLDGSTVYVTANTVFYPYFPDHGRSLFRYFTTGLAAGNSYIEAISHGLAEAVERDASAINLLKKATYPAVDIESIESQTAQDIIKRLQKANLNVVIRYITSSEINVPVFSVICEDLELKNSLYVSGGYGVHPNKDIAIINALNEAALSRVTTISGAREDIQKFKRQQTLSYEDYKKKYSNWFNCSHKINFNDIQSFELPTIMDDINLMANRIMDAGFSKILVVDLSRDDLVLPVVKVLVPGLERYSFKMSCVGDRGRQVLRDKLKQK
jgi:thioglycine synthase